MATKYWLGTATAVAQVHTGSIDSVDGTPADNTFTVTIGGVAVSVLGNTDVNTTVTDLRTALNASTHPYFAAITWSGSSGNIIGTADTAGAPFVAALTVSGGGTGSVTDFAETTASAGPNHWNTATNWSDGAVPGNNDTVIFRDSAINVCWGLAQGAVDLTQLTIEKTYTGKIGLDRTAFATSADGATTNTAAQEYRDHYLDIGWATCDIGEHYGPGSPSGSSRLKLNNDKAAASVTRVHGTASASSETGKPAVRLLFDNASAELYVRSAQGGVGVAVDEPGETCNLALCSVSDVTTTSRVQIGAGVTITNHEQQGGTVVLSAAATVTGVTVNGGTLRIEGDFSITTLAVNAGTVTDNHLKSGGNAVTTAALNGGTLDLTGSTESRTLATVNLAKGATLKGDDDVVTITTLNEPDGPYTLEVS